MQHGVCYWGQNNGGQIGDGSTNYRLTPVTVLTGVAAVAGGRSHTLAIKTDGTLWSWGTNAAGQLGDPAVVGQRTTPGAVPNVPALRSVDASDHSLAIGIDGSGWSWGLNTYGQVGNGVTSNEVRTPYQVFPPGTFGCALATVTPASSTLPNSAGSETFDVTIARDCEWTAASDSAWAQPGAGRTGNGSITVTVPINPGAPRTATLTIAGKTVTLTQQGYAIVPPANEEISYFHTDAIGSVRMITSATGAVVARYDYLPFGGEWGTTSTFANNVKFAGGERDPETATGAWTAQDYSVQNPVLQRALNDIYRWQDRIAGGLTGAVRYTQQTGRLVAGSDHLLKLENSINRLQKILRNQSLNAADRQLTQAVLNELKVAKP